MGSVVVAAASNIDTLERIKDGKKQKSIPFLNGAATYAGYASAAQNADTTIITCVGDEEGNDKLIEKASKYRDERRPQYNVIEMPNGKSFRQTFELGDGNTIEVTNKDMGNYNDWEPKIEPFSTDVLLLGTGNPIFQKSVLDSCTNAEHILLDSKLIHFQKRADNVDELLRRVTTFFGTEEEIKQLLKNNNIPETQISRLFEKYPNLQIIVEKGSGKGGRVFASDGTLYIYRPTQAVKEVCVDGAGDVFAGTYAGMIANGCEIKDAIEKAAEMAAESVKHFGPGKAKKGLLASPDIKIIIEESRWKSRDGRNEKDSNRGN